MRRFLLIVLCIGMASLIMAGCSYAEASNSPLYPAAVAWNYIVYGLSVDTVSAEHIGKEIGQVSRYTTSFPEKNGDCNSAPAGSKLYSIRGVSVDDAIAIDVDGKFYKARREWRLH